MSNNVVSIKMQRILEGCDLIESLCDMLNGEIRKGGMLKRNNHTIWQGYLHQWTNSEWEKVLDGFEHMCSAKGTMLTHHQQDALDKARFNLKKFYSISNRCMDIRKGSRLYNQYGIDTQVDTWRFMMILREIYCGWIGLNLPNDDGGKDEPPTPFEALFIQK